MPIRPLYDRVIVRSLDVSKTTESGIVVYSPTADKPDHGEVVAVGDGHVLNDGTLRPLTVKVGDQVLFGKYDGSPISVDGEDLLVFLESQIIGIIS